MVETVAAIEEAPAKFATHFSPVRRTAATRKSTPVEKRLQTMRDTDFYRHAERIPIDPQNQPSS